MLPISIYVEVFKWLGSSAERYKVVCRYWYQSMETEQWTSDVHMRRIRKMLLNTSNQENDNYNYCSFNIIRFCFDKITGLISEKFYDVPIPAKLSSTLGILGTFHVTETMISWIYHIDVEYEPKEKILYTKTSETDIFLHGFRGRTLLIDPHLFVFLQTKNPESGHNRMFIKWEVNDSGIISKTEHLFLIFPQFQVTKITPSGLNSYLDYCPPYCLYRDGIAEFVVWDTVRGLMIGKFGTYSHEKKLHYFLLYRNKTHYVMQINWLTNQVYWFRINETGIGAPRLFKDHRSHPLLHCGWSDTEGPAVLTGNNEVYVIISHM